jgi:SAM-dependent methyltransferase
MRNAAYASGDARRNPATVVGGDRDRVVLHVGCGYPVPHKLHAIFRQDGWREIRLDVNEAVKPDLVCSLHEMGDHVPSSSFDAVWSSHSIEHLHAHEVAPAFREFARVLRPDGFALIRCPDLEAVARDLLQRGPDEISYLSPAGPITPLDMIYGHARSVANGNSYMRHHTGFTAARLERLLLDAGFLEVRARGAVHYDLWAVALMPQSDPDVVLGELAACGLAFDG